MREHRTFRRSTGSTWAEAPIYALHYDAQGNVVSRKAGAVARVQTPPAVNLDALPKEKMPAGRIAKWVVTGAGATAVGYWGGTLQIFDKAGNVRARQQLPQDIGGGSNCTALPRADKLVPVTTSRDVDFRDGNLGHPARNSCAQRELRRSYRERNVLQNGFEFKGALISGEARSNLIGINGDDVGDVDSIWTSGS